MFKMMKMIPKKLKTLFIIGALLTLCSILISLIMPNIISQFIKLIFQDTDPLLKNQKVSIIFFNGLIHFPAAEPHIVRNYLILGVIGTTLVSMILTFISTIMIVYSAEKCSEFFRNRLCDKLLTLSIKNISTLKQESIITRVSNDVATFWDFLVNATTILIRGTFMCIGGSILAILVDPLMSTSVLVVVPIIAILIFVVGKIATPKLRKGQKQLEVVTKNINENVLGARVIKTYNLEELRKKTFEATNNRWRKLQYKAAISFMVIGPIFYLVMNFLIIGIYSVAANKAYNHVATSDTMVNLNIFIDYLYTIGFGLMNIVMFLMTLFRAKVSAKRVNEIFESKADNIYVAKGLKYENNYELDIRNLNFKYYDTSPKYALKNINLFLAQNKMLGIIGPTGSGKSTLVNLILNNYVYDEGSIKLGNNEIKKLNTKDLHDNISIVYQEPLLYTGTIKSNLLWAKEDANQEQIEEALANACASEFVNSFEDKLEHPIVQGGKNLSGGQKQRLTIARTLLRKPRILILDDSTSALDNVTTKKVINNIKNHYNCSSIIISQKIGAIKNADEILVMDNGQIVDRGTHEELVKSCELYNRIYKNQLEQ